MLSDQEKLIKNSDSDNIELINYVIGKYRQKKNYIPVDNVSITIKTEETTCKLIRLNDEQFNLLYENHLAISADYGHLMSLDADKDVIYSSLSRIYVALKEIFGESGNYYDDWKCSFSFPFLIYFQKENEEFGYLMNIYNVRSSIEFNIAKLMSAGDDTANRNALREPFAEFPREEMNYFINYFIGYLTGRFEGISKRYDEFFFLAVRSNHILFGYKEGHYFDEQYKSEEDFYAAIQELEKYSKSI